MADAKALCHNDVWKRYIFIIVYDWVMTLFLTIEVGQKRCPSFARPTLKQLCEFLPVIINFKGKSKHNLPTCVYKLLCLGATNYLHSLRRENYILSLSLSLTLKLTHTHTNTLSLSLPLSLSFIPFEATKQERYYFKGI